MTADALSDVLKTVRLTGAAYFDIAAEIGYESEAAFSRAFKKMTGVPPSAWRLGMRPGLRAQTE